MKWRKRPFRKGRFSIVQVVLIALALITFGAFFVFTDPLNEPETQPTVTIGSKDFTESYILAEIYAQTLEKAGFNVKRNLGYKSEATLWQALTRGQIDLYPEYVGTALGEILHQEVPSNPDHAYALVAKEMAKHSIVALRPAPFQNTNAIAAPSSFASEKKLSRVSDLQPIAPKLTLSGPSTCPSRSDCLAGWEKVYGLRFKKFVAVPIPERHLPLEDGRAQVGVVFTTDPQIKRQDETVLTDDKHIQPPQNPTLLIRNSTLSPTVRQKLADVDRDLTVETMQRLNAMVDFDHLRPAVVAQRYLSQHAREDHVG